MINLVRRSQVAQLDARAVVLQVRDLGLDFLDDIPSNGVSGGALLSLESVIHVLVELSSALLNSIFDLEHLHDVTRLDLRLSVKNTSRDLLLLFWLVLRMLLSEFFNL